MQISFPTSIYGASPAPRTAPLSLIFPLTAICDLDATLSASYSSGQVWNNIITNPVDGSAQSAYNFNLGASNSSSTDDPTFIGTPGDTSAYFSFDGGDYFSLAGAVPTFLNNIHKNSDPHTLIVSMNVNIGGSFRLGLFSTTDTGNSANTGLAYDVGYSAVFWDQRDLTNLVSSSRGGLTGNNIDLLLIISHNPATNILSIWDNTLTAKTNSVTFNPITNSCNGVPAIGAKGTGSKLVNGSKLKSCALLKLACTNTEAKQIYKFYNKRHNTIYTST